MFIQFRSRWLLVVVVWCGLGMPFGANETTCAAQADDPPLPGRIRLRLPSVVQAVVGIEANLYFDNLVLTIRPDQYAFDVICDRGQQQKERWTWTPTDKDIGRRPLKLEVRDESNELIARGQTTILVSPADAGAGRSCSVLMVGDSLTHASVYPAHVLKLCQGANNPRLKLIGSFEPAGAAEGVRHEGYGGWTAARFATHYAATARQGDYGQRGSPFLYLDAAGDKRLDFARYCQDVNGGEFPDYVTIFLGPNDVFGATDATIESITDEIVSHLDRLLAMIHAASPKTQVGLMLAVPPAASQDAFGSNYAAGQTRWQYKRNQHRLVERMLDRYERREREGIHLLATYVNLDCQRNYPAAAGPVNARNSTLDERQNNGVHPANSGYEQIGDTLFAWLKAQTGAPAER